jgi:hypothetical protein
MDIKIGEYVRTKSGFIGKVIGRHGGYGLHYELDVNKEIQENFMNSIVHEDNIVKHSKNIIDLIEVRDIVEYQVNFLSKLKIGRVKSYRNARSNKEYLGVEGFDITKIYIKSILTHEQYNANCHSI